MNSRFASKVILLAAIYLLSNIYSMLPVLAASYSPVVPSPLAPSQVGAPSSSEGGKLTAKKRRRKRKRRSKKGKRRRRSGSGSSRKGKGLAKTAAKATAGIVTGIETEGTIIQFGGDFLMAFGANLNLQGGFSYWQFDIIEELFASRTSMLSFGGGAGYLLGLSKTMWLELAAQGSFSSLGVAATIENPVTGDQESFDTSESSPGINIITGFHLDLGGMALGPEIRYPIYFNDKYKDVTAISILLLFEYQL